MFLASFKLPQSDWKNRSKIVIMKINSHAPSGRFKIKLIKLVTIATTSVISNNIQVLFKLGARRPELLSNQRKPIILQTNNKIIN